MYDCKVEEKRWGKDEKGQKETVGKEKSNAKKFEKQELNKLRR